MKELLNQIKRLRVLVIGDVMLDRYVNGGVHRISPEAPVQVLTVEEEKIVAGGAANVALNAAALGASVEVCGWFGRDSQGEQLRALLVDKGVQVDESFLFSSAPTISKTRVTSSNQQICRVDRENAPSYYTPDLVLLKEILISKAISSDLVIVSDYGKGTITEFVFQEIVRLSKEHQVKIFADPKGAQAEKYCGATTFTPNRKEFEIFVGEAKSFQIMASKGKDLIKKLCLEFLLVTLSESGMLLIYQNGDYEHIPTSAREIYDVTGAGDTVIAIFATLCTSGYNPDVAAKIANDAAGIVVGRSGAAKLSTFDFDNIFYKTKTINILSVSDLQKYRKNLGKIVMTNGCFDLLHRGHVEYLNEAKALGDTLIVALNSDKSIAMIKGSNSCNN